MPQVFDALLAKGFKFVTVSELLAMDKGGARLGVVKTFHQAAPQCSRSSRPANCDCSKSSACAIAVIEG
jgi:hypothetical protein